MGIVWIVVGAVIILDASIFLLGRSWLGIVQWTGPAVGLLFAIAFGLLPGIMGGSFVYEGIALCRGTIPSTVGVAVGSNLFALMFPVMSFMLPGREEEYHAVLILIAVVALFLAGIVAFAEAAADAAWWQDQHAQRGQLPAEQS